MSDVNNRGIRRMGMSDADESTKKSDGNYTSKSDLNSDMSSLHADKKNDGKPSNEGLANDSVGDMNSEPVHIEASQQKSEIRGVHPQGGPALNTQNEPIKGFVSSEGSSGNIFDKIRNFVSDGISMFTSGVRDLFAHGTHGVVSAVRGGTHAASNVCTKVGSKIGVSPKVAGGLMAGVLACGGIGGSMLYSNYQQHEFIMRQDTLKDDCKDDVEELQNSYAAVGDVSAMQLENAQKVWAVGKALGLTDEQCAGMLGNMMTESQMDPSAVEGIFTEPFDINGPKKTVALSDLCVYFRTVLGPSYGSSGCTDENGHTFGGGGGKVPITASAYIASKSAGYDGCFAPGIGLVQWTGPRSGRLQKYAEGANMDWWELDIQLAFLIGPTANGADYHSNWIIKEWTSSGNPEQDAINFANTVEGCAWDADTRRTNARNWYTRLKGYSDDQYAQSILSLAQAVMASGAGKAASDAEDGCKEAERQYDNSDAARAAVAFAWKTTDLGKGNNGTELYQTVHDAIWGSGLIYQSCDVCVATAITWSGTDDSFPHGDTDSIDVYCQSSPKWEDLGEFDGDISKLQPGDIINTTRARRPPYPAEHGHIVIYVGNEIVREKFPDSDACFVSASYETRSPGCEDYSGQFTGQGYHVYRCVQPETNSRYVNVAEGFSGSDGR